MTNTLYEIRFRKVSTIPKLTQKIISKQLDSKSESFKKKYKGYCIVEYHLIKGKGLTITDVYAIEGTIIDYFKKLRKLNVVFEVF